MARDTSPQCKQCRREGQKLFLKGERCLTDKCGVERRSYPPGDHGRGRQKQSEYRVQLREKQKARRYYGVLEKQFRNYYDKASRQPGITGENLLRILECRFDNVLVRLGFAASRRQARQLIRHGHWTVNGRRVDIPCYQVRENDVIAIKADTGARPGHPRRDGARRPGAGLAAGGPRRPDGEGAAQARARGDRGAGAGAAHRRAVLQVGPCARDPARRLLPAARADAPPRLDDDVRTLMLDFQIPRITAESVEENRGSFTVEPLDRGFGYTFGNSLRRVLLASLAGAAVTSVRIEGVAHEFSTIKGVSEDVTDIVLNLKGIVCRMHSDATEVEAPLVVTGPGEITARDIDLPSGVEILNPDAHIATLEKKTKLELYLTIGRGRGYRPAEDNKSPDQPIGVIPIDSIFSPVQRVAYSVEQARVGQRTDFDKLTLDIETDGSIDPQAALREAAEILISSLAIFTDEDRIEELRAGPGGVGALDNGVGGPGGAAALASAGGRPGGGPMDDILIEELELGVRSYNCLKRAGIQTVGDLDRQVRGRAGGDPELRQEVDRRGRRDPRPSAGSPSATTRLTTAMRHQKTRHKLSRDSAHRKALLANLCVEVIDHERIKTTEAKAKAVKPELEKLITLAKKGDLHARRQAISTLQHPDKGVIYKLFEEIAPRYAERPGGYTRILKLGPRPGDATELVYLELV